MAKELIYVPALFARAERRDVRYVGPALKALLWGAFARAPAGFSDGVHAAQGGGKLTLRHRPSVPDALKQKKPREGQGG